MANRAVLLCLMALALGAIATKAQSSTTTVDFKGTLEKNGYKLAAALFDIANFTAPMSKPAAVYTVLVPTDAAIEAFLKEMGLTVDDLKKRPLLAKQLAAQHVILKANVRPQELFANGPTRIVATAAKRPNDLVFNKGAGDSVTVTDVQGNTANVQKPFEIDARKTGHPIDKVLMPASVFFSFADLCKFRAAFLKDFCNAVKYAGLNSTLNSGKFDATVFVPNNHAFVKAISLDGGNVPSVAATADILKYHVVSGYKTLGHGLPTSIKGGVAVPALLAGQDIKVTYERQKPSGSRKLPYAKVIVTSSSGNKAEVLKANVHVGKALVQGVDAVLMPSKAAIAAKPAAAKPAAATKPAPAKLAGRHLLDFGWDASAGPTAESDAAASAIAAAASGDENVANAANSAVIGGEELSVPGDYQQVDDGLSY
eukprot:GHUV01000218.1.p1 GENE.GHUV01000218.1~~GHUV01000218.1.p1  ORF type:complete len:426 (+),score=137.31 GHUV01000218.1:154-1431(+)